MLAEAVGVERRGVHRAVVGLRERGLVSTSIERTGLVARLVDLDSAEPTPPSFLDLLAAEARRRGNVAQADRIRAAGVAR